MLAAVRSIVRGRRAIPSPLIRSGAELERRWTGAHQITKCSPFLGTRRACGSSGGVAEDPHAKTPSSQDDARRRFCVVGSGPAGMYATNALLSAYGDRAAVDVVERLPTPFGLVRSGVAPDHAQTKSVVNRFEKILRDPRVSFLGNVALGRDVHVDDLARR